MELVTRDQASDRTTCDWDTRLEILLSTCDSLMSHITKDTSKFHQISFQLSLV